MISLSVFSLKTFSSKYMIITLITNFSSQTAELNQEVSVSTETLHTTKSEIGEVRRLAQSLEIKLQAQISKVHYLHLILKIYLVYLKFRKS